MDCIPASARNSTSHYASEESRGTRYKRRRNQDMPRGKFMVRQRYQHRNVFHCGGFEAECATCLAIARTIAECKVPHLQTCPVAAATQTRHGEGGKNSLHVAKAIAG